MAIPVKLERNNSRFITLRTLATLAADTVTPPTDASIAALGEEVSQGTQSRKIVLYWTATGAGGTATLEVWIRDGLDPADGTWLKVGDSGAIAPGVLAAVDLYRADPFHIAVKGSPTGTDMVVRGYGLDD